MRTVTPAPAGGPAARARAVLQMAIPGQRHDDLAEILVAGVLGLLARQDVGALEVF